MGEWGCMREGMGECMGEDMSEGVREGMREGMGEYTSIKNKCMVYTSKCMLSYQLRQVEETRI
jgi:hypothetical protein